MLQAAIVAGELPAGTRLRDQEIALQLGVSRTPVREALQRLEVQGLIETRPGASTTVAAVDLEDAVDVFPVVAHLHGLAARLGVENLTPLHLMRMRRHNEDVEVAAEHGDRQAMIDADSAFHQVLVEASGNKVIAELLERLTVTVRRLEYAQFDAATGHTSAHDHDDIVVACEKGDAELVASLVEHNWLTLGQRMISRLRETAVVEDDGTEQ